MLLCLLHQQLLLLLLPWSSPSSCCPCCSCCCLRCSAAACLALTSSTALLHGPRLRAWFGETHDSHVAGRLACEVQVQRKSLRRVAVFDAAARQALSPGHLLQPSVQRMDWLQLSTAAAYTAFQQLLCIIVIKAAVRKAILAFPACVVAGSCCASDCSAVVHMNHHPAVQRQMAQQRSMPGVHAERTSFFPVCTLPSASASASPKFAKCAARLRQEGDRAVGCSGQR